MSHNLRPVELGALLWALTFNDEAGWKPGGAPRLRHRLGMAKPYGFGEIILRIEDVALRNPRGDVQARNEKGWIDAFTTAVAKAAPGRFAWADSIQVKTLLAAADPERGQSEGARLDYMGLHGHQAAKQEGAFLPYYADGREVERGPSPAVSNPSPRPRSPHGGGAAARQPPGDPPQRALYHGERVEIDEEDRGVGTHSVL